MASEKYIVVRDMDPELVDAELTMTDSEEADELLEMAYVRKPQTRLTIYQRLSDRVKWLNS